VLLGLEREPKGAGGVAARNWSPLLLSTGADGVLWSGGGVAASREEQGKSRAR
jgi:pyridoxal biosynthesis lyase PdxS